MRGTIKGTGTATTYWIDGSEVTREELFASFKPVVTSDQATGLLGWKPVVSDALAVHPSQVEEATADAKAKGVAVEFLPDGRPVFSCRSQRKAYMRAYGFHDRNGGYGD